MPLRSKTNRIILGIGSWCDVLLPFWNGRVGNRCPRFLAALRAASAEDDAAAAKLPLTRAVLFTSGIGYFQHDGNVTGDTRLEFKFDVQDVNDLLKSIVLRDFDGGRSSSVTYTSRDPVSKTLKSFAIDLTENPSLAEILDQVRGEQVEVAAPTATRGGIVGTEAKLRPASEDEGPSVKVELLNLLTDEGLRSIPLEQVRHIHFERGNLDSEFRKALAVLASSHDREKKSLVLKFSGEGQRRVSVGYITQWPLWKTSYRLVLDQPRPTLLQGWAVVENTSDRDWKDVELALVSGRPISFRMDLYEPLYVPRPLFELDLYRSLRPQRYAEAMDEETPTLDARSRLPATAARAEELGRGLEKSEVARYGGFDISKGVQTAAQAAEVGELFQYDIELPVSLPRQQSALLPIVSAPVEAEKLSVYNERVHAKHPLNGLRITNTTGVHLMQGPITVFDEGSYAGDAQIADLQPAGERLVSYAIDLEVEVEPVSRSEPEQLVSARLAKGTLISTRQFVRKKTYNIRNRGDDKCPVLVEHPLDPNWDLKQPSKPAERTREVYRFVVSARPDGSSKLEVVEQRNIDQSITLADVSLDAINIYLRSRHISAAVMEALSKLVAMRHDLDGTTQKLQRRERGVGEVTKELSRIRQNMERLPQNPELYGRYVKILTDQEDQLATIRQQIEELRDRETEQRKQLEDYLLGLEVE